MKRKLFKYISMILSILYITVITVSATNLGTVSPWNCDTYQFYFLESGENGDNITYKTEISTGLSNNSYRYTMYNGISTAIVYWRNANTGITIDSNPSTGDTDLVFYVGDRNDMEVIVPRGDLVGQSAVGYTLSQLSSFVHSSLRCHAADSRITCRMKPVKRAA